MNITTHGGNLPPDNMMDFNSSSNCTGSLSRWKGEPVLTANALASSLSQADLILFEALNNKAIDRCGTYNPSSRRALPNTTQLSEQKALQPLHSKRSPYDAVTHDFTHTGHTSMDFRNSPPNSSSVESSVVCDSSSSVSQTKKRSTSPLELSISSLQQTLHSTTSSLAYSVQKMRDDTLAATEKLAAATASVAEEDADWNTSDEEDEWGVVMSSATRAAFSRLQRAFNSLSGALYEFGQLDANQELFMIGAVSLANVSNDFPSDDA